MPTIIFAKVSPTKKSLTFSLLLLVSLVGVVAARIRHEPEFNPSTTAVATIQQERNELRITLNSQGFDPQDVQHAAGTFAIAVENTILSGEYTLQLKNAEGTVLYEMRVQKGSSGWTVNLAAGQYTLTEATNQQWVCRISIQ